MTRFAPGLFQATHNTGKLKQDVVLCKIIGLSRNVVPLFSKSICLSLDLG